MRALRIVARTIVLLIVVFVVVFLGRFAWSYGTMAWTWASQAIHAAPPPAPTTPTPVAPAPKQEPASPTPTPPPAQPAPQIVKETVIKEIPKEIIKEIPGPTKEIPTGLQCGVGTVASDGKCVPTPTPSIVPTKYCAGSSGANAWAKSSTEAQVQGYLIMSQCPDGRESTSVRLSIMEGGTEIWAKTWVLASPGEQKVEELVAGLKPATSYTFKVGELSRFPFTTKAMDPAPTSPPAPTPTPPSMVAPSIKDYAAMSGNRATLLFEGSIPKDSKVLLVQCAVSMAPLQNGGCRFTDISREPGNFDHNWSNIDLAYGRYFRLIWFDPSGESLVLNGFGLIKAKASPEYYVR